MNKRLTPFDQLCELPALMAAWKQVRASKGAAGVDRVTIAEFERELVANLTDLSQRVREGRYYPMPARTVEIPKRSGGTRSLGILTVEDRIVQRAALDALEPLWEPAFLDCSFGFRPERNVAMAVKRVLDHRAAGDVVVVDADIQDCFGSIRHEQLMSFVSARVRDKRMLALIRMWLDSGQALSSAGDNDTPLLERLTGYATDSVNQAMGHLLEERSGYAAYRGYAPTYSYETEAAPVDEDALRRQARNESLKRLGRDAALFGLTYVGRARRLVSPTTLALAGAAVVAGVAAPLAVKAARKHFGWIGWDVGPIGTVQGGALSPLLCNIYLHEFDVALTRAGLRLVRYADDFVICCRTQAEAERALALAARELERLGLRLHPAKTRVTRFDEGLEFLGYRFEPFANHAVAAPAPQSASEVAAALLEKSRAQLAPATARLKEKAAALKARLKNKEAKP